MQQQLAADVKRARRSVDDILTVILVVILVGMGAFAAYAVSENNARHAETEQMLEDHYRRTLSP